ncbi:MAG TPA: hypothetical protein VM869_34605, partial [Enhygromyxa sp.]|nr:hypothetical protein [Enhygromyxa sp.]
MRLPAAMGKRKELGDTHETLADLLQAIDPRTLIRIVAAAAGVEPGELFEIGVRDPRIQIPGLARPSGSKIVDGIYTIHSADGTVTGFWLFEVELSFDGRKRRRWSLYVVAFEHELDADGQLAVFSPVPALRDRIRARLVPRMRIKPILIEPDQIERITDHDDARRRPELTILGCLFHAHAPAPMEVRLAVFRAAWIAIQSLDDLLAWRYASMVMSLVPPEVIDQGIAELREAGQLDESRMARFYESERWGHTFHRGREEGRVEVARQLLVELIEQRGFTLGDALALRLPEREAALLDQLDEQLPSHLDAPLLTPAVEG